MPAIMKPVCGSHSTAIDQLTDGIAIGRCFSHSGTAKPDNTNPNLSEAAKNGERPTCDRSLERLIVPSKVDGIAAAGRPSNFIGDKGGEIARLLATCT